MTLKEHGCRTESGDSRNGIDGGSTGPQTDEDFGRLRRQTGSIIHQLRMHRQWPLKYLAAQVGVSIAVCSQWEHGKRFPSAEHLVMLARIFGCQPSCLLCKHCFPEKESVAACRAAPAVSLKLKTSPW